MCIPIKIRCQANIQGVQTFWHFYRWLKKVEHSGRFVHTKMLLSHDKFVYGLQLCIYVSFFCIPQGGTIGYCQISNREFRDF